MPLFKLRTHRDSLFALVAAAIAAAAVLGAVLGLFDGASHTPWAQPGSRMAREARHCLELRDSAARHRCLRAAAVAETAPFEP